MPIDINSINNLQAKTAEKPSVNKDETNNLPTNANEGENSTATVDNSVQLSDRARNLQRLTEEVEKLPVVDTDRVEAIRQTLNSGNYEIDAEKVAASILDKEGFSFSNES